MQADWRGEASFKTFDIISFKSVVRSKAYVIQDNFSSKFSMSVFCKKKLIFFPSGFIDKDHRLSREPFSRKHRIFIWQNLSYKKIFACNTVIVFKYLTQWNIEYLRTSPLVLFQFRVMPNSIRYREVLDNYLLSSRTYAFD